VTRPANATSTFRVAAVLFEVRGGHRLVCGPLVGAEVVTGHQVVGPVGWLIAGQDPTS
jgi:hypothetical protein